MTPNPHATVFAALPYKHPFATNTLASLPTLKEILK